jgi:hypothetical protein
MAPVLLSAAPVLFPAAPVLLSAAPVLLSAASAGEIRKTDRELDTEDKHKE